MYKIRHAGRNLFDLLQVNTAKTVALLLFSCVVCPAISSAAAWNHPQGKLHLANNSSKASAIVDADWSALNTGGIYGASGPVYAEVFYKNRLYIGGDFKAVGTILARNVAQWDGATWSPLGSGIDSTVYTLAVDSSGALYAGGTFSRAGGNPAPSIARWSGNAWSGLGSGPLIDQNTAMEAKIMSITVDRNGMVYAGGRFDVIAGVVASKIARWDGSSWSAIGDHLRFHRDIYALACDKQGILYAGGDFDTAGGICVRSIARWNGARWDSLGGGIQGGGSTASVHALLCEDNGDLLAGGSFFTANDTIVYNIARWDGSQWRPLDRGLPNTSTGIGVYALAKSPTGAVVAGGSLPYVYPDTLSTDIAQWNGQKWSPLGIGFYDRVHTREEGHLISRRVFALAFDNSGKLYAGGNFASAGGISMKSIAQWDGVAWSPVGPVMSGPVRDVVNAVLPDHRGNLYVGGNFDGGVARLSGTAWTTLSEGIRGTVLAMCMDSSGNMYAAGQFDSAGGHKAKNIAKWDGTKWSPLDLGLSPGPVRSLFCGNDGKIFAAGDIGSAGRVAARGIARWDGNAWDSLPQNFNNPIIFATTLDPNGTLLAAGSFRLPNNYSTYSNFAQWNGQAWDSIKGWQGWSNKNTVTALAMDGQGNFYLSVIYATNSSTGDVTITDIVKCDGGVPQRLGRVFGPTLAIATDKNGNLYVAGNFDSIALTSGYVKATGVVKWNGGTWEALGGGLVGDGRALAVEDSTLYVGGKFYAAGTNWSPYIAKLTIHNFTPGVLHNAPGRHEFLRMYYRNGFLNLIGGEAQDEVSLFSLSGKLLKRFVGDSRIDLNDLPANIVVARIKRNAAIICAQKILFR